MVDYSKFEASLEHLARQWENHAGAGSRPELSAIDREALAESVVHRFETCYDCLWKVLKHHLAEIRGVPDLPTSPKPILRIAAREGLLPGTVEQWLEYANARVLTAHDYSGEKAAEALALVARFLGDADELRSSLRREEAT